MSTPDHFVQSPDDPYLRVPLPPDGQAASESFPASRSELQAKEDAPPVNSTTREAIFAGKGFGGKDPSAGSRTPPDSIPASDHFLTGSGFEFAPRSQPVVVGGVIQDELAPDDATNPSLIRMAPPWLLSMFVHMIALIAAGLIFLPEFFAPQVHLELIYDDVGEQLEEEIFEISSEDVEEFVETIEPVVTPDNLIEVKNPLAAPQTVEIDLHPNQSSSELNVPEVGLALTGREKGMKDALLKAYGGTDVTEAAVQRALGWFKRNQNRRGHWSLSGPYRNGTPSENQVAATAMALLAFQGAGHTHLSGQHAEVVRKGWYALLGKQKPDGDFWQGGIEHHRLYSQAQATIAICELYGMTRDEQYREPAQRAVDYAVKIQDVQGGWRYRPGSDSDTSVTGWFVMALQSARMAYLNVDPKALENVSRYLDLAASRGGARYGYLPGATGDIPMTAEALLCRQYLGWMRDDERLLSGVRLIDNNPIEMAERNVYYWYYATQVLHHLDDDNWERWNKVMREEIPKQQVLNGPEKGSWTPNGDRWGSHGGRLFTTALSTYMLEVYYRHLPIYADPYKFR